MLKKLIEELLTDVVPDVAGENLEEEASENETSNFLQLYDKIDTAESKNEDASQVLFTAILILEKLYLNDTRN